MAESAEPVERPDYNQASAQFVEWFQSAGGTRLSSKVQLRDLRTEDAGRGAGSSSLHTLKATC